MNELEEYGRSSEAAARRAGLRGEQHSAIGTLASDLFGVMQLSDRWMDEDMYSIVGRRVSGFLGIGAVVGEQGSSGLVNPANSNVIAVVEMIHVSAKTTAGTVELRAQNPAVEEESSSPGFLMDSRFYAASQLRSACRVAVNTVAVAAGLGNAIAQYGITPNTPSATLPFHPHVLAPGSCLWVTNSTANELINVTWRWRERNMSSGETKL